MTPARLLVVDDDDNNRDMLSRRLQRRGFAVESAADGPQAITAILGNDPQPLPFDLILLDIEMPGMNGFEVLTRVRQVHDATRCPVIIATARHDREDIVHALELGANDYVTKPIDFPVVLARVETQLSHKRAVDRIVALEAEVRQQNETLIRTNARMLHSLQMAAKVQQSLLPSGTTMRIGNTEFAWAFKPCDELGGDILNAFPLADGTIGIYLLDVSGHGVPAALLSVTLSRVLAPFAGQPSLIERVGIDGKLTPVSPAAVVTDLNRRFPMGDRGGQYFTIFYAVFDPATRTLRYVSAGHPPAVVLKCAAGCATPLKGDGFAIGWFDDAEYAEQEVSFAPGDRLVIYSDGVTETMDAVDAHFGCEKLGECIGHCASMSLQDSVECIMSTVDQFRGTRPTLDDVTILAMQA